LTSIAAAVLAVTAAPVAAGSLQVDPVKVEITAERKIAAVKIKNEGSAAVTVRGYALGWEQVDGEDRYEEVSSIIVSPPVATIAAGGEQLMRVGIRPSASGVGSYRLIVEEVPDANPGAGIQVALRLSMPLFVYQKTGALADLSWSAVREADGSLSVEAKNRGSGYVRIEPAEAKAATGIDFAATGSLGTVLPNSSRRWVMQRQPTIIDRARFERIARTRDNAQPKFASKR